MYLLYLVGIIAVLIYIRWRKVKSYWAERNVPHLPPNFVLGSLTFLQQKNPGIWMRQISERFSSPYVGGWWFWRPVLIINSPEITRNILVKHFNVFRNRLLNSGAKDPIGGLNIFTVNDPIWSDVRRQITKLFSSARLKKFHHFMAKKSKELVQRIKNDIHTEIDLRMMYTDYTTDLTSTYAFGVESNVTLTKDGPFRAVTKEFMTYNLYRGLAWCSIFFCPELVDIMGFTLFPKSAVDYFRKVFNVLMQRCENKENKEESENSLLGILIKMREENKDSSVYTDDLIVAQAAILLFGGFDTSGSALTFLTYQLAHHPDIQEKLYQEVLEATRASNSPYLDYKQLSEMTYLDCAIKETLRLYPSMGWLDRIASIDYCVDEKLTIKAGTPVYINSIGMHYNPEYFPDPYKFNPDRFLPENEKNIVPYTYMPFGDGPRSCIGQRFAMQTIRNCVASVVFNFSISPLPNKPKPSDIKIENRGLFYAPGEKLSVKFTPRLCH